MPKAITKDPTKSRVESSASGNGGMRIKGSVLQEVRYTPGKHEIYSKKSKTS